MTNKPQNNQIAINEKAAIDIRVASSQVSRHDTDRRELYTEQEVVKILFLASEHSLFRNAQAVQVSMFVRLCQEHDVLVVTP